MQWKQLTEGIFWIELSEKQFTTIQNDWNGIVIAILWKITTQQQQKELSGKQFTDVKYWNNIFIAILWKITTHQRHKWGVDRNGIAIKTFKKLILKYYLRE